MIESLPNRPLKHEEITAIADGDGIELCKPIAELRDSTHQPIVGLYMSINDTVHITGYIRNEGWEIVAKYESSVEGPELSEAVDALLEWSDEHYDASELSFGTGDTGIERTILKLLPDRPVGKQEVELLNDVPETDVVPVFAIEETDEIMCVVGFTMALDGTLVSVIIGFNEDHGWSIIDRQEFDLGVAPDPDLETAFDWADNEYGDQYVAIDNRDRDE